MRVMIIGAGKVGFSIAELLSTEHHDVLVVEASQERARIVNEKLDVQVVWGNGASPALQKDLDIGSYQLLVALTDSDEVNMLACMLAKQAGVQRTVARVRRVDYATDPSLRENPALDIDLFINPEQVTALAILNHIRVPEALTINHFDDKQAQMLELYIPADNHLVGKAIREIDSRHPFLILAITRDDRMIIPNGDDAVLTHDHLFIIARTDQMGEVEADLGFRRKKVEQVFILGGGRLGRYLAEYLEPTDIFVKILEKDYARCEFLASHLDSTIVLNGDVADVDLLQEEGIADMDVIVGATEDDKLNVLSCLLGSSLGAKKTIAQIRRSDYLPLIESVGIDAAVSPRDLTSEAILRFVRKGQLHSVAIVGTGQAEVIDFTVTADHHHLINKSLADLPFPKGVIVSAILREGRVLIPGGKDVLLEGDRVSIFVMKGQLKKLERMLD